ncbi:hypothetical protein D9756_006915 [Leucocoprinus leucothites]|uniref:Eisosome component PIL1-domain-containing protein n=1 Tax=Leucocoprinus leucothites TaxID=201217 RepID=A0A8H5FYL9_9AGAR|nr:hypothetical protein D9756_006915 [Leucoagaricus leucothites]
MFRKIAHNSTIPALAGNQDLRPLQDLITAEKAVIISLQKLAADFSRASEALKTWGLGEGDDLGNILSASTTIITHFTSAVSQYASHGHTMREQLKAIRTREEQLDDLRRRRRGVMSKADSAEKKLQKMGPEHKNLMQQNDTLNRLREEIRGLDVEIMREEAAIGDFKRAATRSWMGLKFGGLLECCEKGVIVGEYGKLVVSEVPEDETQPGLPRNPYFSHAKIESLLAESHRCVNEVRLSTVPSSAQPRASRPPFDQQLPQVPAVTESPFLNQGGSYPSPAQIQVQHPSTDSYDSRRDVLPDHQGLTSGRFPDSPTNATNPSPFSQTQGQQQHQPQYSGSLSSASAFQQSQQGDRYGGVDEFGSPTGPIDIGSGGPGGRRFATFPVRTRTGSVGTPTGPGAVGAGAGVNNVGAGGGHSQHRFDTPPSIQDTNSFSLLSTPPQRQESDTFSNSVAQALAATSSYDSRNDVSREAQHGDGHDDDGPLPPPGRPGRYSKDGPAPSYESSIAGGDSGVNPWAGSQSATGGGAGTAGNSGGARVGAGAGPDINDGTISDDDEVSLAYGSYHPTISTAPAVGVVAAGASAGVEDKHTSRHVRFGTVSDINSDGLPAPLPPVTPQESAFTGSVSSSPEPVVGSAGGLELSGSQQDERGSFDARETRGSRVISPEEQEKVLNAAAAREIALELQSHSATSSAAQSPSLVAPAPAINTSSSSGGSGIQDPYGPSPPAPGTTGSGPFGPRGYDSPLPSSPHREMSPLVPPTASYMAADRRSVSPRPPINTDTKADVRASSPEQLPSPGPAPSYTEEPASYTGPPQHPLQQQQQYEQSPQQYQAPTSPQAQTYQGSVSPPQGAFGAAPYRTQQVPSETEFNPYEEHHYPQEEQGYQERVSSSPFASAGAGAGSKSMSPPSPQPPSQATMTSQLQQQHQQGSYSYYANQPLEQPNAPYMRPGMGANRSSSSLNSPGGGKISAAAFKRPSPRPGGGPPGSPFAPPVGSPWSTASPSLSKMSPTDATGKKLPSPYESTSPFPSASDPPPAGVLAPGYSSGNTVQPLNVHKQKRETQQLDADQYDYIHAYVNSGDDEGYYADQTRRAVNANVGGGGWAGIGSGGGAGAGAGASHEQGQGGTGQGGGYGQGKFATNLDFEGLR